jgi:hypothetical protein
VVTLSDYTAIVGEEVVGQLYRLAEALGPRRFVHVNSPEGCAFRIRYLLHRPEMAARMGKLAKEFARQHFLITRTLRDYLTLLSLLENPGSQLIEL